MRTFKRISRKIVDPNTKSVVTNVVCSFGVKGLSMFIGLFTTPTYIRYFDNNEVLGIWFTLLSVLAWILNCDMGIGNGLRNKLVVAMKSSDKNEARKYVSSCYIFSVGISGVIIVIVWVASYFINWNKVFNAPVDIIPAKTLATALAILLVGICTQLVLRLITSILYALQKAFIPGFLNLCTNILMLLYALLALRLGVNGSIINMSVAYFIAVNVPLIAATAFVFLFTNKELSPSIAFCKKKYAVSTLRIGGMFLWIQLMAMILNSTNSYFVTLFVGNSAVVEFNIYGKIFLLMGTLVTLATTPIWSATTKAQAEKNYEWLYKLFKKFSGIALLAILGEFVLIIPLQFIFNLWLGERTIVVNYSIALLFALFGSVLIWSSSITCFVNGLGELKLQSIFLTVGAIIDVAATYYLAGVMKSYVAIIIANILAYTPYLIVQTIWLVRYLKTHTERK